MADQNEHHICHNEDNEEHADLYEYQKIFNKLDDCFWVALTNKKKMCVIAVGKDIRLIKSEEEWKKSMSDLQSKAVEDFIAGLRKSNYPVEYTFKVNGDYTWKQIDIQLYGT